ARTACRRRRRARPWRHARRAPVDRVGGSARRPVARCGRRLRTARRAARGGARRLTSRAGRDGARGVVMVANAARGLVRRCCVLAAWLLVLALGTRLVHADEPEPAGSSEPEPPPEAGDGDYTLESADSLGDDELELSVAAAGGAGSGVRRSQ